MDDPDSYPDAVTEASKELNPGLKGRDIRDAFAAPEFHLLLVANKFQTRFDQPLLARHVHRQGARRHPGGADAVAAEPVASGKDTTYILDFVNEPAEILKAFKTYYQTAELEAATDPHLVYDLRAARTPPATTTTSVGPGRQGGPGPARHAEAARRGNSPGRPLLRRYKAARSTRRTPPRWRGVTTRPPRRRRTRWTRWCCSRATWAPSCGCTASSARSSTTATPDIEKRFPVLQAADPAAGIRPGARHGGPQQGGADPPHPEEPWPTGDGARCQRRYTLPPIDAVGSGAVQEKEKTYLDEIIQKVNGLFEGELTTATSSFTSTAAPGQAAGERDAAAPGRQQHQERGSPTRAGPERRADAPSWTRWTPTTMSTRRRWAPGG